MDLDGRSLDGAVLETDVCVVGAGPAGLTLAGAFVGGATDVLVLDSGGLDSEPALQRLNEGRTVGDRYAGLRVTRHRQVGGAANLWNTPVGPAAGAKYVPLDPADLTGIPTLPWSGWPLAWSELERWYRGARRICGLDAFDERAIRAEPDRRPLDLPEVLLESKIYELGSAGIFTKVYPDMLRRATNVRLCHHATVYQLRPDRSRDRAEEAFVATLDGTRFRVRADTFVLAAGAVENARMLLASEGDVARGWLASTADWVGRCFMEHPRDHALTLVPRAGLFEESGFYDSHINPSGAHVLGRVALAEELRRRERLPNVSVTLLPRLRRRLLRMPGRGGRYPRTEEHWSEQYVSGDESSGASRASSRHDAFTLLLNLEQLPHRENRVVLATRRDRLGLPAAELHWRWRKDDQLGLERTRAAVAREFEACGLGRVEIAALRPDPNAHHHAGTTRMSLDGDSGVVDPTGRVHGTGNLYACGASVFPTAGFANPTLTIVALALRLASHLGAEISRSTS